MLVSILTALILLAACFAPPNLMLRAALNDHAYTAPLTITLCLFIVWGYCIGLLLKKPSIGSSMRSAIQAIAILLVSVIALSGVLHAINTMSGLRNYAQAWDNRDREIREAIRTGRTSPFLGPLTNYYDSRIPIDVGEKGSLYVAPIYSPYRWDLTDNPSDWVNKCIAWYYGISAIVTDP
jgi:ABC-type transport system involved in multi-copper enzyme maturation permease subunit